MKAYILLLTIFLALAPLHAKQPKIYDCFMFLNEFEVLELRLEELYPYVDKFVIVEASETHRSAKPKPFYFELNKERFARFADKIIHIKLTEHIETEDGWVRENWQRNQIMRGLSDCKPRDLILISDCDEYIPGHLLAHLYPYVRQHRFIGFWQKMCRWYLNRDAGELWSGTIATLYKELACLSPQELRNKARADPHLPRMHAGWHFSSMGGYETVKEKYDDVVEGSDYFPSYPIWRKSVMAHHPLTIDSSFPHYVQTHIEELIERDLIDPDPQYVPL